MKNRGLFLSLIFIAMVAVAQLSAAAPVVDPGTSPSIREQGLLDLSGRATDPDGDPIHYRWEIHSDPTGNAFFRLGDGSRVTVFEGTSLVRFGLAKGSLYPEPSFAGAVVVVRLTASDGESSSFTDYNISVNGVNREPVVQLDVSALGSRSQPRLTSQGFAVDASSSYDPDGGSVKFLWRIIRVSGGQACDAAWVLHGKETLHPGFAVPRVSATPNNPMSLTLEYFVEDGLNFLTGTVTGYMATEGGCSSNDRPEVSAEASPSHASYGERVTLQGHVFDPGDTHSYSWVQLDTTGEVSVSLAGADDKTASFVAPNVTTTLRFRFTATDSSSQSDSGDVEVRVSSGGGGSGGGVVTDPVAEGIPACDAGEGNEPAHAEVPARVEINSGERLRIDALNGADPDNTEVFVAGQLLTGVNYQWELVQGAGLITSHDLEISENSVAVDIPAAANDRVLTLALTVADAAGCGTRYIVEVLAAASAQSSDGPTARLRYRDRNESDLNEIDGPVAIASPATIVLDARGSQPSEDISYAFVLEKNLEAGTAQLVQVGAAIRHLQLSDRAHGQVQVTMTVTDSDGLTDGRTVEFQIEAPNDPPVARLTYAIGSTSSEPAPGSDIKVTSPAEIVLDASQSEDEGPLSYAFVLEQDLSNGGAVMTQLEPDKRLLTLDNGSTGAVTVTITVTDERGATDATSLRFVIDDASQMLMAFIAVRVGGRDWSDETPVEGESVVSLDGSSSRLAGGDQPEGLQFKWTQLSGPPVNLVGADQALARFRVPPVGPDDEEIRFRLEVAYQERESEPSEVTLRLAVAPIYFSQVAFGPVGELRFRTVLVLINSEQQDAEAVEVDFLNSAGDPMDVVSEGETEWVPGEALRIESGGSKRLRFASADVTRIHSGWARVRSNVRLTGLVLYQLVTAEGEVDSEVSLFSSPAATNVRTFFDPSYGLATALANPNDEAIHVQLKLIDSEIGEEAPIAAKVITLEPGGHLATFLDSSFFGALGPEFTAGTLVIESDGGPVLATVLKTRNGLAISSMPLARR